MVEVFYQLVPLVMKRQHKLILILQSSETYGGDCIYEYFVGCNSGTYYHVYSDVFQNQDGGIDQQGFGWANKPTNKWLLEIW